MSITEINRNIERIIDNHESRTSNTTLGRIGLTKEQVRRQLGVLNHGIGSRSGSHRRRSPNGARDEPILKMIVDSGGNMTASQVAKKMKCGEPTARLCLRRLVAKGLIKAKPHKPGSKWTVYSARRAKR